MKANFYGTLDKKLKVIWEDWNRIIEERDKSHPRNIPHPRGSIQEAVEKAINELKGGMR